MKLNAVIFLILLLAAPICMSHSHTDLVNTGGKSVPLLEAHEIQVKDDALARKIAISFHHAILEVNYEENFIIADLSAGEIEQIQRLGLQVQPAKAWNKRYLNFTEGLKEQLDSAGLKTNLAGIPGFDCYPTVEETLSEGEQLAQSYPQFAEWIDIGNSWNKSNGLGGYDLMVLKITNQLIQEEKPKLFIHSSMHAREYTPATLNLDFGKLLLNEYSNNPDIRWIVDYHEVHLLFHMNPDGRKIAETGISQRKNTNTSNCPEGASNGTVGVDLNRNFSFTWNSTVGGSSGIACDQTFRGVSAESEPETQAVSNYIRSLYPDSRGPNPNDAAPDNTSGLHLDIHSYSQLILWPNGHTESPSPNDAGFVAIGNKLAWYNNYTPQQSVGLYPTDGTSDNVSYGELGIAALTFELGSAFFQQCSVYQDTIKPDNLEALIFAAKLTAAPYLLAHGPEVSSIQLNQSESSLTATQGSIVTLKVVANSDQTKQVIQGRQVSKVEYSIDIPIWKATSNAIELNADDGSFDSSVEASTTNIDTSNLALGRHTIYLQAYNQDGQAGVTSAIDLTIANNSSPIPLFTTICNDLDCSFDASSSSDTDGTIESYLWDFGDGQTSDQSSVEHSYLTAGQYNIELFIIDNTGNSSTKTGIVTVNNPVVFLPTPEPDSSGGGGSLSIWLISIICLFRLHSNKKIRFTQPTTLQKHKFSRSWKNEPRL